MRCNSCNKFVSNDEGEPEVQVDMDGTEVSVEVRFTNNCAECGQEMTEFTFSETEDLAVELMEHRCGKRGEEEPSFSAEEMNAERTNKSGFFRNGKWIPAGGRYAKTFYGAEVEVSVKCDHCGEQVHSFLISDEVQASSMEEIQ